MRKLFVIIIAVILLLPMILGVLAKVFQQPMDVPLLGYTDAPSKPPLTLESYANGSLQQFLADWFELRARPRGVYVKNYCSVLFTLFKTGKRIIGKNDDIFEDPYINYELCIPPALNYTDPAAMADMAAYVEELKLLRQKLAAVGKPLILVLSPSKANFHAGNIPSRYQEQAPASRKSAAEAFAELIRQTDIPQIIGRDMKDSLTYPPFYTSGIHWSRTFEQTATRLLLTRLRELTGKDSPVLELGEAEQSDTPYFRDADVYNLENVWAAPKGPYYMFKEELKPGADPLRVLIQGTSFSDGFIYEFFPLGDRADVIYINRQTYYREHFGDLVHFTSYDELHLADMLDRVDAVVIEAAEPMCPLDNRPFVQYLLTFLDTYQPKEVSE